MSGGVPRRHRGFVDDARGGLTTFLVEIAIVAGLVLVALVVSAVILLLV
mgnify:FL=1